MVKDFLLANAFYWLEVYHVDGLRLDDVDSMLYLDFGREYGQWKPNIYGTNENLEAVEFLKHLNSILDKKLPGTLTIAQEDGLWSNSPEAWRMTTSDSTTNGTTTGQEIFLLTFPKIRSRENMSTISSLCP